MDEFKEMTWAELGKPDGPQEILLEDEALPFALPQAAWDHWQKHDLRGRMRFQKARSKWIAVGVA